MRYLMQIQMPAEPFNTLSKKGMASSKLSRVLEETKPEAIYFTDTDGERGAIAVYNLEKVSEVPSVAEPWFLTFNARVTFRIAMTPGDLKNSGLDELGKKWA